MSKKTISTLQAISICVTVMISHIILDLPNNLITNTGSSSILNLIYVFGITIIIFLLASKVLKIFPGFDIMDICEYVAGKKIKNVFSAIICVYLLVISAFVIRIFAESLVLIYFPNIDLEVVILIFITITAILNLFEFRSIAQTATMILPIILIAMVTIFIYSMTDFTPQRALPIFGYGLSETFITGLR